MNSQNVKDENTLLIRIHADNTAAVDYVLDGTVIHKSLSVIEIVKALKQSSYSKCVAESGLLPKNCIAFSRDMETDGRYYVIEHTERKSDIVYHNTAYTDFPLPRLVFGFGVSSDGRVCRINVAVVGQDGGLNEETPLYHFPFSNVSGFAMCTGSNKLPVYKKASSLNSLPNYLLMLPNNDDHYNKSHNKFGLGYRELLEHLKDKSPDYYYSDVLVQSGKKLKDFI
ncbi:MAG: prokaryotic E2 ligase family D protein [Oscillospiraceae bacterium]|nr:prokaryotic E2 ligase family D protein [Oscillospiraceae bacterium]